MNHREKLEQFVVLSIASVAEILGGDEGPVSAGVVYRLLREGQLDRVGKGKVSAQSVRAYLAGERTPAAAPRPAPAHQRFEPRRSKAAPPADAPSWEHLIRHPRGAKPAERTELPEKLRLVPKLPRPRKRTG